MHFCQQKLYWIVQFTLQASRWCLWVRANWALYNDVRWSCDGLCRLTFWPIDGACRWKEFELMALELSLGPCWKGDVSRCPDERDMEQGSQEVLFSAPTPGRRTGKSWAGRNKVGQACNQALQRDMSIYPTRIPGGFLKPLWQPSREGLRHSSYATEIPEEKRRNLRFSAQQIPMNLAKLTVPLVKSLNLYIRYQLPSTLFFLNRFCYSKSLVLPYLF